MTGTTRPARVSVVKRNLKGADPETSDSTDKNRNRRPTCWGNPAMDGDARKSSDTRVGRSGERREQEFQLTLGGLSFCPQELPFWRHGGMEMISSTGVTVVTPSPAANLPPSNLGREAQGLGSVSGCRYSCIRLLRGRQPAPEGGRMQGRRRWSVQSWG